ncbi:MAG: molybdopterin dinucleotide-binding protein, partial [Eggerthellaceae bacterium]|nr:molybdopterin dinucleotide-binding protein [Eggerthellaceae bacterium]
GRGVTRGYAKVTFNPNWSNTKAPKFRNNYEANGYHPDADKFPLNRWYNQWTDAATLVDTMLSDNPYPVKLGVSMTGNFMNQSNASRTWEALKQLDFYFVGDLWHVPQSDLADILVPSAMWLEMDFPRISQGPAGGQGATCKAIDPPGEALTDLMNSQGFAKVCGLPFNSVDKPYFDDWDDYLSTLVKGGKMTWKQYKEEFQKNGWWDVKKVNPTGWGTYRRWEMGYLHWKGGFGVLPDRDKLPGFYTPTRKVEIWSTVTESILAKHFDKDRVYKFVLPDYEEPKKSPVSTPDPYEEYPFVITTGSRNPTYFHSEHRQVPWCRELWTVPRVEINPADAKKLGVKQGDWVWIETPNGKVRETVDLYYGIKPGVVNANHTWWYPELDQVGRGWELSNINNLVDAHDQDPIQGTSTLRAYLCKVYKATPENSPFGNPCPCGIDGQEIITSPKDERLKKWLPDYEYERAKGYASVGITVS